MKKNFMSFVLIIVSFFFVILLSLSCDYGKGTEGVGKIQSPIIKSEKHREESQSYIEDVKNLIKQGRFVEARQILEIQMSKNPDDMTARFLLVDLSFLEENYKEVKILSDEIGEKNPYEIPFKEKSAIASLIMQELELAKGGFENILLSVDQLIKKGKNEGSQPRVCNPMQCCVPAGYVKSITQINLATTYYSMKDLNHAETLVNGVLYEKPELDCAKFTKALILSKRGNFEESAKKYQEILEKNPYHASTLNNLGVIRYMERDFDTARKYFESSYQYAGFDARLSAIAWMNIGELEMQMGNYDSAEKYFREAIEISPTYAGSYFNLGVVLDIKGNTRSAHKTIKNALALDKEGVVRFNSYSVDEEWRWYEDALIAEVQGNEKEAILLWHKVVDGKVPALIKPARKHIK